MQPYLRRWIPDHTLSGFSTKGLGSARAALQSGFDPGGYPRPVVPRRGRRGGEVIRKRTQEARLLPLTICLVTRSKGSSNMVSVSFFHARACLMNPAPGIQNGRWRTSSIGDSEMSSVIR